MSVTESGLKGTDQHAKKIHEQGTDYKTTKNCQYVNDEKAVKVYDGAECTSLECSWI
jgi:hypothetical protein